MAGWLARPRSDVRNDLWRETSRPGRWKIGFQTEVQRNGTNGRLSTLGVENPNKTAVGRVCGRDWRAASVKRKKKRGWWGMGGGGNDKNPETVNGNRFRNRLTAVRAIARHAACETVPIPRSFCMYENPSTPAPSTGGRFCPGRVIR